MKSLVYYGSRLLCDLSHRFTYPGHSTEFFDGEASYFRRNYNSFFAFRIKTRVSSHAPNRKLQMTARFIGHCRISCGSSVWNRVDLLAPGIWRWPILTPTWLSFLVGTSVAILQGRTTRLRRAKDRCAAKLGNKHFNYYRCTVHYWIYILFTHQKMHFLLNLERFKFILKYT